MPLARTESCEGLGGRRNANKIELDRGWMEVEALAASVYHKQSLVKGHNALDPQDT